MAMDREVLSSALLAVAALFGLMAVPANARNLADGVLVDTDGDGLADAEEVELGTSVTRPDTDGDGLLDGWEVSGLSRGGYFEPLHEYGADPLRKDVFVEIDWMETARGSIVENARIAYQAAVDVTRVFERSGTGIRIHFDLGAGITRLIPPEDLVEGMDFQFAGATDPRKTIPYRDAFPGRPGCPGLDGGLSLYEVYHDPRFFRPSRRNLFYYLVLAEQAEPLDGAAAVGDRVNAFVDSFADENAQRDGLRATGVYAAVVYRRPVAPDAADVLRYRYSATVLHELGHAFGLGHGGALPNGRWDQTNQKANYASVMNYRYVFWGVDVVDGLRRMDFSHGQFRFPLREYDLIEHLGMGALPNPHILENLLVSHLENSPFTTNLDWNHDGRLSDKVRRDLNGNGRIDDAVMTDHDDWGKFLRDGFDGIGANAFRGCGLDCARGESIVRMIGDFDGSGRDDVAFSRGDALAVALLRSDGSLDADSWSVARGDVGGWKLEPGRYLVGDFLGEGRDLLFDGRRDEAALLGYEGGELEVRWSSRGELSGDDASWRFGASDQVLGVRLLPSAMQLAITDGESLGVIGRDGTSTRLSVLWRTQLNGGDEPEIFVLTPGRSFSDGTESFFVRSPSGVFEVRMTSAGRPGLERLDRTGTIEGSPGSPEGWSYSHDDCLLSVDLDGDREDEVLIVGSGRLGVVDWTTGGPRLVWKAEGKLGPPGLEWKLADTGRVLHGGFDPAAGELVVLVSDTRVATLAWNADEGRLDVVASQATPNVPLTPWQLHPAARILTGRFLPDHGDLLLAHHDRQLLLLAYSSAPLETAPGPGFYPVLQVYGSVDGWSFSDDDVLMATDVDEDPEKELFVRKGDLIGILDLHPRPRLVFLSRLDEATLTVNRTPTFLRGDVDSSDAVDLTDAVVLLTFLFFDKVSLPCGDAADVDDSGDIDLADPVNLLEFLFSGGAPPPAPGAITPGIDPTVDGLSCGS